MFAGQAKARTIPHVSLKRLPEKEVQLCEPQVTHIDRMFIRLDNNPKHLTGLQTLLIHQLHTDVEQLRKRMLHDLVKLLSLLTALKSVHPADGEKTLQAGVDGTRIVGAEELEGDVQEPRPLLGEVMLKDFLKEGDELSAHVGGRRGQRGNQPLTETGLFGIGNRRA